VEVPGINGAVAAPGRLQSADDDEKQGNTADHYLDHLIVSRGIVRNLPLGGARSLEKKSKRIKRIQDCARTTRCPAFGSTGQECLGVFTSFFKPFSIHVILHTLKYIHYKRNVLSTFS